MFKFGSFSSRNDVGLLLSQLYSDQSFYPAFIADTKRATASIIIESPFITYRRLTNLYSALEKARKRGITITINTRDPQFHEGIMQRHAAEGVAVLQDLGVTVLYTLHWQSSPETCYH